MSKRMPLDARIIGWIGFVCSLTGFLGLVLLMVGIAHISPSGYHQPVLFGIFLLASDLSLGVYTFIISVMGLISAYGLIKGYKFGWWFTLILCINGLSDSILTFSEFPVASTVFICTGIGTIIWLLCRRHLYSIRVKREEKAEE
jgi:hypothetical protein